MTTRHDGTVLYTPFPGYEVEDPVTGSNTTRTAFISSTSSPPRHFLAIVNPH
jgi:hypothetical protein